MKKIVFTAILSMFLTGCFDQEANIISQTVMITNLSSTSGGSGTIVEHHSYSSKILTNAHVCDVAKAGGIVHTSDNLQHIVVNFVKSKIHDLCLLEVQEDLGVAAQIKQIAPAMFDEAIVSGHPKLSPVTITKGKFGSKKIINVGMGFRPCAQADMDNPDTNVMCLFIGKVVLIKTFEAIFISALIQPGSSGSGVYDLWGKIGAVIFAGEGDLGFGYAVPLEYVHTFLFHEAETLTVEFPNPSSSDEDDEKSTLEKYKKVCNEVIGPNKTPGQTRICRQVEKYDKLFNGVKNVSL